MLEMELRASRKRRRSHGRFMDEEREKMEIVRATGEWARHRREWKKRIIIIYFNILIFNHAALHFNKKISHTDKLQVFLITGSEPGTAQLVIYFQ